MEGRAESRARNPAQFQVMFSAPLVLKETRPLARAQDRLLGPCFKTGPGGTSILSLPIDGPRRRREGGRVPRRARGNPSRARLHTTCSKPHLAAQAFGTERRYCGASNQGKHQGATVGRPARTVRVNARRAKAVS